MGFCAVDPWVRVGKLNFCVVLCCVVWWHQEEIHLSFYFFLFFFSISFQTAQASATTVSTHSTINHHQTKEASSISSFLEFQPPPLYVDGEPIVVMDARLFRSVIIVSLSAGALFGLGFAIVW